MSVQLKDPLNDYVYTIDFHSFTVCIQGVHLPLDQRTILNNFFLTYSLFVSRVLVPRGSVRITRSHLLQPLVVRQFSIIFINYFGKRCKLEKNVNEQNMLDARFEWTMPKNVDFLSNKSIFSLLLSIKQKHP